MFAYCNNNPTNLHDKSGKIPDTFAGWVGEEIGKFIYECITGDEHPSHETEAVDRTIRMKQVQLIQSFLESEEYNYIVNSEASTVLQGSNKIRAGVSNIKKGAGLILLPCPTEVEDITGIALITYGIVTATFGLAQIIIGVEGALDE